jgi:hypothetical protein
MDVDSELLDAAESALRTHPNHLAYVCAAYSNRGRLFLEAGLSSLEEAVTSRCRATGELIAALASVTWHGDGCRIAIRAPASQTIQCISTQARRHARIAVSGWLPDQIVVRALWEILRELSPEALINVAREQGRFGQGMKSIAAELSSLASGPGVAYVDQHLCAAMLRALQHPKTRSMAASRAHWGSQFLSPLQLESISLRHLWLALEMATEEVVLDFVDSMRRELSAIGCTDADIIHIKQGFEALRNTLSALFVAVGTGRPVYNECPFYPYHSLCLRSGIPLHEYVERREPRDASDLSPSERNRRLVSSLSNVLAEPGEGGFIKYLRQRRLFTVDLFDGHGPGHCPFAPMSVRLIQAAAAAFQHASRQELILLDD